jgi:flagellar hook-associated protein 2
MSTAPLTFTGVSTFSNDFQTILQREQQINQIPIKALQNRQADNTSKKAALIALNPLVGSLGSAVSALASLGANQGLSASTSDSSVSVINTGATSPGNYTISNLTLATAASETSLTGYADPASTPVSVAGQNKVDLVVGSNTYHLDLTGKNNLNGLVDAINNTGAGVTASILSNGSSSYLNIQANSVGATTLALNDVPPPASGNSPTNLITNTNQGTNADFMLNGNIHVNRASNVISDAVPGLTFTLNRANAGSVGIALASDRTQLSQELQTFVQNYNALVDQVGQQVGTAAGALGGSEIIRSISDDMRQLSSYWLSGNSSVRSLYDVGITFDDTSGHMTFNQTAFDSMSSKQVTDSFSFFGASNSGFSALAKNFSQLSDPALGMIRLEEDGIDKDSASLTDQISVLATRASQTEAAIQAKLQQADALVASLQSEQTSLNAAIQSVNYVTYGKVTNANGQS